MSNIMGQLLALDDSHQKRGRKNAVRAPFGYPGSKERSLNHLLPHVPYRERYIEPCGGSGAVLLARHESKLEVFNDRHSGITAFYKCIADRDKCKQLIERVELIIHSREYWEWCQETWETMADDVERAARWYTTVQMSFNSKGWEFGRSTKPPGFTGRKIRHSIEHFWPLNARLGNVQIENLDWRLCFEDFDNYDAVFYVDPPYWNVAVTYDHHWTESDHIELCERIMKAKGCVIVSGYDEPDHPYNQYKWDAKHSWEVAVTAVGLAFQETNKLKHREGLVARHNATETIWIKEIK